MLNDKYSFRQFCNLREVADLWAYMNHIQANPNVDDLKTLANMLAKNNPQNIQAWFSDMLPTLQQIIAKLPPQEQQDVQQHFARLKHQDPRYDKTMFKQGWRRFTSLREFEDFVTREMENPHPQIESLMQIIQSNEHMWQQIDHGFKDYFVQWLKDQQANQPQQANFGAIIKNAMSHPPMDPNEE